MYRIKGAMNISRIWDNHFSKLTTISLNWLNLCCYRWENATYVVNNYDWFLSIYKRSLSTKLLGRTYTFFIISTSIRKTLLQRWHIHMTSEKTLLGFRFISNKHFCNKVDGLTLSVQNGYQCGGQTSVNLFRA